MLLGQKVNYDKSSMIFGSRVRDSRRRRLQRILDISKVGGGGKYLGLPEQIWRNKSEAFSYITDRVKGKILNWYNQMLSPAGKVVLIKYVALATPIYSMNCFLLPKTICDEINSTLTSFWWGTEQGKRKIPWVAWKRLSLSKRDGGLGFRDLHTFNKALLAKQAWRLMNNPHSLLARLYKGRYHRHTTFLESECGKYVSHGWRSIQAGKDLLKSGLRKRIGVGNYTRVWHDNWLPTIPPRPAQGPSLDPSMIVDQLWIPGSRDWNDSQLQMLIPQDAHLAKQLILSKFAKEDTYIWPYSKDAQYNVKSGYCFATHFDPNEEPVDPPHGDLELKRIIWSLDDVPPKLQYFLWRILSQALPTSVGLVLKNVPVDPVCQRCNLEDETINHILFTCPHTKAIWRCFNNPAAELLYSSDDVQINLALLLQVVTNESLAEEIRLLPIWILWNTWKSRNEFLFEKRNVPPLVEIKRSKDDVQDWLLSKEVMSRVKGNDDAHVDIRSSRWEPPPSGWWKCNFDASLNRDHDFTGVGWIVRDANGNYIKSGIVKLPFMQTSLQAEALAFLYVLQYVWVSGWTHIWFETDNLELSNLINTSKDHPTVGTILQDIRFWTAKLPLCSLGHVNREKNQAADVLSKHAYSISDSSIVFSIPPVYLINYLYEPYTV